MMICLFKCQILHLTCMVLHWRGHLKSGQNVGGKMLVLNVWRSVQQWPLISPELPGYGSGDLVWPALRSPPKLAIMKTFVTPRHGARCLARDTRLGMLQREGETAQLFLFFWFNCTRISHLNMNGSTSSSRCDTRHPAPYLGCLPLAVSSN